MKKKWEKKKKLSQEVPSALPRCPGGGSNLPPGLRGLLRKWNLCVQFIFSYVAQGYPSPVSCVLFPHTEKGTIILDTEESEPGAATKTLFRQQLPRSK